MMRRFVGSLGLVFLFSTPVDTVAQSAQGLANQCATAGGDAITCARAAGAARDLAGYVGVLAGPGAALSGQSSALGMRLGGMPRFAMAIRAAGVSVVVPDLSDGMGVGERSDFVPTAEAMLAVGVFEGFSVLPTVGGLLSLDLMGSGSFLFFPDVGFNGRLTVISVGARVGILRESFTLPAVTVSFAQRFTGELALESTQGTAISWLDVDPSFTSLRATVGKDLFAFGVMAGVGWDDFTSLTTVRTVTSLGIPLIATAAVDASRRTYFGGLSKQFGVLSWISAEAGWVQGFDPVTGGGAASPDTGRSWYGSVALVLKL